MRSIWHTGLAVAASALIAGAVDAATVVATFTGSVLDSYDQTGVFLGGAGQERASNGQAFTLSFKFDPDTPGAFRDQDDPTRSYDNTYGGPGSGGYVSPMISAALTIGGRTASIAGNRLGQFFVTPNRYFASALQSDQAQTGDDPSISKLYTFEVDFRDQLFNLPTSLDQPFSIDLTKTADIFGNFQVTTVICTGLSDTGDYSTCSAPENAFGVLNFSRLDVTVDGVAGPDLTPAPVPLPASAWLLGTALAALTVLPRRRNSLAV